MPRSVTYLGIAAALLAGVIVTVLSSTTTFEQAPLVIAPVASSTVAAAVQPVVTTEAATSSPTKPAAKKIVIPTAPASSGRNAALDATVSRLLGALVNIICYSPRKSGLHSMSASGIIIDPKGIILTNAHVGQYFLLADRGVSCVIRSGRPATDQYKAALIYISPQWLRANSSILTETDPSGTGQYDFALLAVTKSATNDPLPDVFPYEPFAANPVLPGTPIVIATYAAQFLQTSQIVSNLYSTVVSGSVKDVFTFATDTIDVLALGGSPAAQEGSSGGGVVDASGQLVGIITTSTIVGDTSIRSLDAITAAYVRAEFAHETNGPLGLLLAEPTATAVANFAPAIPSLESIITAHLP